MTPASLIGFVLLVAAVCAALPAGVRCVLPEQT